jgi:hypothetical protein
MYTINISFWDFWFMKIYAWNDDVKEKWMPVNGERGW